MCTEHPASPNRLSTLLPHQQCRCSPPCATPSPTAVTMWRTPLGELSTSLNLHCAPHQALAFPLRIAPSAQTSCSPKHSGSHAHLLCPSRLNPPRSPFAGIYAVWQCTCVNSRSDVPVWILVIGGVGLVVGLATYGASEWLTAHRAAAELVMGSRLAASLHGSHPTPAICAGASRAANLLWASWQLPLQATRSCGCWA